ncbi:uncharacterized protein LOC122724437 [Manihot esculenta]|uniref:uncharacterized protein LOC122724437 n=1 Tax=Manihot esculenta TaxID=3983 RepID=UPI001CC58DC1|nr:uncharacterized protein LOC122724437 [Manihot esculenta]
MAEIRTFLGMRMRQQRKYDLFSSTYNPRWRDNLNLSYRNRQQNFQPRVNYQIAKSGNEIEHTEFRESNELTCYISEQAGISRKIALSNRAKSKIECKRNYAAKCEGVRICQLEDACLRQYGKPDGRSRNRDSRRETAPKIRGRAVPNTVTRPPFPERLAQSKRYAKFLKDLCTDKRKLYGHEKIKVGENVSAKLQRKFPQKCKDKCMFAISCKVENPEVKKAMYDLEAFINVMPLSSYLSLDAGPLKQTGITLQLANRSIVYPKGVLEDVLV